ncbi:hypothetical protein VTK26DRAFT_1108 [Humicola hyalothermophila]
MSFQGALSALFNRTGTYSAAAAATPFSSSGGAVTAATKPSYNRIAKAPTMKVEAETVVLRQDNGGRRIEPRGSYPHYPVADGKATRYGKYQ